MKKIWIIILIIFGISANSFTQAEYDRLREQMVKYQIEARDVKSKTVLDAMRKVPRHEFVPEKHRGEAYNDYPLPIGYGQTISQPYIVALMTELAEVTKGEKVLEIGTGSGYQAAVLAEITDSVFSIEIITELTNEVKQRFQRLGLKKITVKNADGYYGWKEFSPFDAIIVTAAAEHIPPPLIEQLKQGGKMIIPVGHPLQVQDLLIVEKKDGKVRSKNIIPVRFVPLVRGSKK